MEEAMVAVYELHSSRLAALTSTFARMPGGSLTLAPRGANFLIACLLDAPWLRTIALFTAAVAIAGSAAPLADMTSGDSAGSDVER